LTRSLSVLLPVHNAQATLEADVGQMLDVLPELTHDFHLMILDDGSTDATCEVAEELTTRFPQVKYHRHSRRRGAEAAIRDGLARTQSPVVLAHNGQSRIDVGEVLRVWPGHSKSVMSRPSSFQILRRDAGEPIGPFRGVHRIGHRIEPRHHAESIATQPSKKRRPNFLSRIKNFALGE
jgi:glycosyltransferase involved in cell wall biosynthesis